MKKITKAFMVLFAGLAIFAAIAATTGAVHHIYSSALCIGMVIVLNAELKPRKQ